MTTFLFSLLFVSSGVPELQYTDLTFGECIHRMLIEQDAIDFCRWDDDDDDGDDDD